MELKSVHILLLVLKFVIVIDAHSDTVNYYEQLIKEGIQNSTTYELPKDAKSYRPNNEGNSVFYGDFDYVIIGGGSAGAVIAARLSEVPFWNILLIEAGKEENDFTDIPSMSSYTMASEYNWGFTTTPQSTCCLAMNGVCPYPRGKSLGGTSVLNALVYSRGNALDYDKWANQGNPGWSYAKVLPYFIKSENSNILGNIGYHGVGGYLNVEYHKPLSVRAMTYIKANEELGLPFGDYNGRRQSTVSPTQFTIKHGRRLSSAKAFLEPASNRRNLLVLTESYATKIITSGKFKKASRVVFSHKNVQYYVGVKKEVILSAGVVGSPQLLMQSGIGPAAELRKLGIPVVVDLDVGKRMHDHVTFYNLYYKTPQIEPSLSLNEAIKQYLRGVGPLTISTNPQSLSFHSFGITNSTVPDIEVVIVPSVKTGGIELQKRGVLHGHADHTDEDHTFQIVLVLLHPKTRGSITLSSNDPYEYPVINSNCLDDAQSDDIEQVYKAIQLSLDLMETSAFKVLKPKLVPYAPCRNNVYLSKAYWMCVIRQTSMNAFHGGGTCRMGPNPLQGDVVDNELRVYGVSNLRVADVSVVPVTLSAHMSAPAMMIGEKLADLIKRGKA